jgi:ABC-2 type transport system ATP-binding protein
VLLRKATTDVPARDRERPVRSETSALVVRGMQKSYGSVAAVKGIDLRVEAGEIFCLLGPNGAGKTTTIEILEGFRSRSGGVVSVLGMDPEGQPVSLRRRIGIVPQEGGLPKELTVAELLDMYRRYYPAPRPVDELLEIVGLGREKGMRVKRLSGGQRRRVDLALALAGDPELLFLDEPTTGFDPGARRRTWEAIRQLAALEKTVVLTTHYLEEAQELANRAAIMVAGRIVAEGSVDTLADLAHLPTRISFTLPRHVRAADVPVIAGADLRESSGRVIMLTRDPSTALYRLTSWARRRGVELAALAVTAPSLEEVYLELTGDGRSA